MRLVSSEIYQAAQRNRLHPTKVDLALDEVTHFEIKLYVINNVRYKTLDSMAAGEFLDEHIRTQVDWDLLDMKRGGVPRVLQD